MCNALSIHVVDMHSCTGISLQWDRSVGTFAWGVFCLFYMKILYLTREFRVKFALENRYCTNLEAMSVISVFKCNLTRNSRVRWWIFLESHNWIKRKTRRKTTAIALFGFIRSAGSRKPFQSQLQQHGQGQGQLWALHKAPKHR